jgi:hypothetical protein
MRLVIDALELNYARQHIDTFVIASGDSDFCPLAYKLRENNKTVIGLAVKEATSPFFVRACDEFLYLPTPGRGGTRHRSPEKSDTKAPAKRASRGGAKQTDVPAQAREVVKSLLARATGPLNPSLIKETLVRRQPDFDERDHGFSTFSRLLQALEKEGLLHLQQKGRQWYVLSPDGAAEDGSHKAETEADAEPETDHADDDVIPDPEE